MGCPKVPQGCKVARGDTGDVGVPRVMGGSQG